MSKSPQGASSLDSKFPFDGMHLSVTPEPTPQEMAALAAAVHILQSTATATPDGLDRTDVSIMSRWARAGRLEAMRGLALDIA
ncbi:MAG: hypothetical protein ACR2OU_00265 [Thermomicrobiales bacterium]